MTDKRARKQRRPGSVIAGRFNKLVGAGDKPQRMRSRSSARRKGSAIAARFNNCAVTCQLPPATRARKVRRRTRRGVIMARFNMAARNESGAKATRTGTNKRQRSTVITARFNDHEAEALRKLADKSGLSIASLIRNALLNTPPPRAPRRPSVNHQAAARVLAQLGKIGSNINQLAHHANAGRPLDRMSNNLELALRDLSELRLACLQALGQEPSRDEPNEP